MSTMVQDDKTALEDLLKCCYSAIYAYGVVAAYLIDSDEALDAMAEYRIHRDKLLSTFADLSYSAPPARAAYQLTGLVTDEASARATAASLEENAVAHWSTALFYLPETLQQSEISFLQSCAVRSFTWSGIAKAFCAAN
jgi:Domain of unknown function (DUF4439)